MESSHPSQKAIIEVIDVSKRYKVSKSYAQLLRHPFKGEVVTVLDQVSFSVSKGNCLGILGINGAGKTTLIKILSSLIRPTSGEVWIDGINIEANPIKIKARIGCVVNDERSFFWRLTGRQNLDFFAALNDIPKKEAAQTIDALVDLEGLAQDIEKPFQHYSSGTKQKLAIARALLTNPPILLLDEPSKNLDPLFRSSFHAFLKEKILGEMKKTIVVATNNTQEAQILCSHLLLLNKGKVLLRSTTEANPDIEGIFNAWILRQ